MLLSPDLPSSSKPSFLHSASLYWRYSVLFLYYNGPSFATRIFQPYFTFLLHISFAWATITCSILFFLCESLILPLFAFQNDKPVKLFRLPFLQRQNCGPCGPGPGHLSLLPPAAPISEDPISFQLSGKLCLASPSKIAAARIHTAQKRLVVRSSPHQFT